MKKLTLVLALLVALSPAAALADAGGGHPGDTSPGNSGEHKVTICHHAGPNKTITITVDKEGQLNGHLNHGDTIGPCPTTPPDDGGGNPGTTPTPTPTPTDTTPTPAPEQPGPVYQPPTVTTPVPTKEPTVAPKPVKKHVAKAKQPKAVVAPVQRQVPQTHRVLVKQAGGNALPYTGLPVGVLAAAGLSLLLGGLALRRKLVTE